MGILVLGGSGFIGKHVYNDLCKKGEDVTWISKSNGYDILNLEKLCEILRNIKPRTIINCAAHTGSVHYINSRPATIFYDNMKMILNLYNAVALCIPKTTIINPISNCSYPGNVKIQKEEEWEMGPVHDSVLSFASTRRMIYITSKCYEIEYGINTINWLIPNCYGPGDHIDPARVHALNGIIIRMIKAKKNKEEKFEIWGGGNVLREWVYVKDVSQALIISAIEQLESRVYPLNLAQNKSFSIIEITEMVSSALNYNVSILCDNSYADVAYCKQLDDTLFRKEYSEFKFTDIYKGIEETIRYYLPLIKT